VTADQVPQADVKPIEEGKKGKGKKRKTA
jgi:hypothetical protein